VYSITMAARSRIPRLTVTSTAANTGWPAIGRISSAYIRNPLAALSASASGMLRSGAADGRRQREQHVAAEHHHVALGQVQHARGAVDEHVPRGEERVEAGDADRAGERLHYFTSIRVQPPTAAIPFLLGSQR
jgi:hypothetical protein